MTMKNLNRFLQNHSLITMLLFILIFLGVSCEPKDPENENEEELITDVTLKFTEIDNQGNKIANPFEIKASDAEGIGVGKNPSIGTITLIRGKRYALEISLFNRIENEDITKEIREDADDHQFFFLGTAFIGTNKVLTYEYIDKDSKNNPLGLSGMVQVAALPAVNNAIFRLVLRHDLNKSLPGANNPHFENFVNAGGETDIDIPFPLVIN
jgi:hypothetical protein